MYYYINSRNDKKFSFNYFFLKYLVVAVVDVAVVVVLNIEIIKQK
jgi:hypothetical protein